MRLSKYFLPTLKENPALLRGLNMTEGHVTYPGVAEAFGLRYESAEGFVS